MKLVIISALLGFFGAAAFAQEMPPAEEGQPSIMAPDKPAVETPAAPAEAPAAPAKPAAPAQPAAGTPAVPAEAPAKPAAETPAAPAAVPAVPVQPAAEVPPAAAVQAAPAPKAPETLVEMKKRHGQAVAELKKKQEVDIEQFKASMKGRSIPELREAVGRQRIADRAVIKALKDAQNAEVEQFKKDHPQPKKTEAVKKSENPLPAAPEKK